MMLAAVEAVTKADAVRESRRHDSDIPAKATASESVHAAFPLSPAVRSAFDETCRAFMREATGHGGFCAA